MNIADTYLTYSLLRRLTLPFIKWNAYKLGVINEAGDVIISKEKRTDEQRNSLKMFDVIALNMKKLLGKLPGGNSMLATYSAALFLVKEPSVLKEGYDEEEVMKSFKEFLLSEDTPTNSVSHDAIAGTNGDETFAGHKVFDVDSDAIWRSRNGKHPTHRYKKYVGEDDKGEEIRNYGKSNPKKAILLRNSKTGEMVFLRRKKNA